MHDEWAALWWSEEKERAKEEKWALRVLTCVRKSCRRRRRCKREWPVDPRCPGYAAFPDTKEEDDQYCALLRRMLKRSVAEGDADPVAADIAKAARDRREEERRALAFKRVSAWLKAGEKPEEIFRRVAGREPEPYVAGVKCKRCKSRKAFSSRPA